MKTIIETVYEELALLKKDKACYESLLENSRKEYRILKSCINPIRSSASRKKGIQNAYVTTLANIAKHENYINRYLFDKNKNATN